MVQEIISVLKKHRFDLTNEKRMQGEICIELFWFNDLQREYHLDDTGKSIIDFKIGTVGIEAKLRCNKRKMYKQCERYCESGKLTDLILFTATTVGMPAQIAGVNIYVVNASRVWL